MRLCDYAITMTQEGEHDRRRSDSSALLRRSAVLQRIEDALRAAGVDPERPSHRDLWPFDQLHSRGIMATREHAERARVQPGMHVLEIGCGLAGASRYLAAECGARWRRSTSRLSSSK